MTEHKTNQKAKETIERVPNTVQDIIGLTCNGDFKT